MQILCEHGIDQMEQQCDTCEQDANEIFDILETLVDICPLDKIAGCTKNKEEVRSFLNGLYEMYFDA